jgi:hypothetical protein
MTHTTELSPGPDDLQAVVAKQGRGEPVARPNSEDSKAEATRVKNVPPIRFGSAIG